MLNSSLPNHFPFYIYVMYCVLSGGRRGSGEDHTVQEDCQSSNLYPLLSKAVVIPSHLSPAFHPIFVFFPSISFPVFSVSYFFSFPFIRPFRSPCLSSCSVSYNPLNNPAFLTYCTLCFLFVLCVPLKLLIVLQLYYSITTLCISRSLYQYFYTFPLF